jgi:hypothetical protein
MAERQRDISISEFFSKYRHLLGLGAVNHWIFPINACIFPQGSPATSPTGLKNP